MKQSARSAKNPVAKMDPTLRQQLEHAQAGNQEVQAVFALRPPDAARKFIAPDQTEEMVERVLQRVQQETGESPRDYNVFKNLGSFVIAAPATFITKLLEQEEIASALANRQPTSALIPPRNKRPA